MPPAQPWPARWAGEPFLYLTTIGRRTGRPHRIEIWFAAHDGRLYMLSGGRERADWVRNLQANPRVTVELGDETRVGMARALEAGAPDDQLARELLVAKYASTEDELDEWGRTSLPVVVEFPSDAAAPPGPAAFMARVRAARGRAARREATLAQDDPVRAGGPRGVERDQNHAAAGL